MRWTKESASRRGVRRRKPRRGLLFLLAAAGCFAAGAHAQAFPFTVVLDPAHGGSDTGTLFSAQVQEKTLVLDLANRLRSLLNARGMRVTITREGDSDLLPDVRAGQANRARAGACLLLHATASGAGAHLYTSSLSTSSLSTSSPPTGAPDPLPPWASAQAPFFTAGLQLASEFATALGSAGIPFTLGRVRLAPLDSLQCPAVAVELAPLRVVEAGKQQQAAITDPAYQQRFLQALAAALVQWRAEREGAAP